MTMPSVISGLSTAILLISFFSFSQSLEAVVHQDMIHSQESEDILTTRAAARAESDIQIRRMRNLLASQEIDTEFFLNQIEKMRKKLDN